MQQLVIPYSPRGSHPGILPAAYSDWSGEQLGVLLVEGNTRSTFRAMTPALAASSQTK
jgi:hypothetical protein